MVALEAAPRVNGGLGLAAAHSGGALTLFEVDGRLEWVNRGFFRLIGYAAGPALRAATARAAPVER